MKMGQIAIFLLHTHLLLGVGSSLVTQSMPWRVPCPHQCVCQIKPWYSPQSVYREAPTVDCNDLLLIQLPTSLPQETQTLRLQSNLITLLSLHMEENQLRHLPEAAFFGLPSLQELYLNHNRLRSISPGAFKGLDKLLRLHLNSNRLVIIDRRWFHALPQLEVLMIGGNPISERALEGLQNLESISFYDNHLIKVPKAALQKLPGLKFLDLNKNPIQLVQKGDFRNMLHLKELGLNNMEELISIEHSAMENLPELTKLEITNNPRLSYIHPQAFQKLSSMESLMLNSNALSALHSQTPVRF
uniref:Leucine rich repeat neuronal 2 n=1 Tax=Cyprinus carpio TaxID=7962 RepID=A0A8C2FGG8_CYPCA